MALQDLRLRSGYLFVAVIIGHFILISAQVNSRRGVPLLEAAAFGLLAEVQRGASAAVDGTGNVWTNYVGLRGAAAENAALRHEIGELQLQIQQERAFAQRSRNLAALLELRPSVVGETVAAEVIGGSASPDFRTLTLNKGTSDGVLADMAVVAPGGVVGRVVLPSARAAKVQLIIDRNAATGALVGRSRAQGIAVGRGGDRLQMEYVSSTADVVVGDTVITSGIDGIYPKGFVIGQVESIDKSNGAYNAIIIRPGADYRSLEEVLVVLTREASHTGAGAIE